MGLDTRRPFMDHHARTLQSLLARSRRAMLWAIAEKKVQKAGAHAELAGRYARLLLQRLDRFG